MEMQWKRRHSSRFPTASRGARGLFGNSPQTTSRRWPSLGWRNGRDVLPQPVSGPAQGLQSRPLRGAQASLSEEAR